MTNLGTRRLPFATLLSILILGTALQSAVAQESAVLSPRLKRTVGEGTTPTDGYMVAGDLWTTIKPLNTAEANGVEDPNSDHKQLHFLTLGPDGSNWREPGSHWPGGYDLVQTWRDGKRMVFPAFEADSWGSNVIQANPFVPPNEVDDRFAFAYYSPIVAGANDPVRNYNRPARFTDATRAHLVYEAGFPTNIGVDFKIRAHQYTINEQNLNDFVAIEITMTNTGDLDVDADGVVEATGHELDAITSAIWVEPTIAVRITQTADRNNRFGSGRTFGYAGATDPSTGSPFDIFYWFANAPADRYANGAVPAMGARRMGVNDGRELEGYTDVWSGHRYVGAKQGSIVDGDIGAVTALNPDKLNLFGMHPVGTGAQKGWYSSVQWENPLFGYNDSDGAFRSATATWYEDYGKTSTDPLTSDLSPNSDFFSSGTADDVTSFAVGNTSARPNGDIKYASIDLDNDAGGRGNDSPVWEDALLAADQDFYSSVGFTKNHTFGEDPMIGNGPYGLAVGESMTLVFAEFAGYRFEGLADASRAAEWAWARGWDVSSDMPTPPAPDILVANTPDGTATIHWTDVGAVATGAGTQVDGYKIYRAARSERTNWLDKGFRYVDNYHRLNDVGGDFEGHLDSVNPYFDAEAEFVGDTLGTYQPSGWGPYTLIATIPASSLAQYADNAAGYDLSFNDTSSILGSTYWYYVAAYRGGSFTGPVGSAEHVESSNFTRNGRNDPGAANGELGLGTPWGGTYPFAILSADYPVENTQQHKNMGGPFTVSPTGIGTEGVDGPSLDVATVDVFPNPAGPDVATVGFHVPSSDHVRIELYDVLGRRLQVLMDGVVAAGNHEIDYPVRALSSGVFFVRLVFGSQSASASIVVRR